MSFWSVVLAVIVGKLLCKIMYATADELFSKI